MKAILRAESQSALIMHSERLVDPLDSFVQAISELSKKTKKTLEDHAEIARREFLGGLYTAPAIEWPLNGTKNVHPVVPAWNVLRCLQDGGKRMKKGADVLRGVFPLAEYATLEYEGPTDPVELWQDGSFALRKTVGVQRSRVMRTRPIFQAWKFELPVEVDKNIFDDHGLKIIWREAGIYAGIGEMRPVYGRFEGSVVTS